MFLKHGPLTSCSSICGVFAQKCRFLDLSPSPQNENLWRRGTELYFTCCAGDPYANVENLHSGDAGWRVAWEGLFSPTSRRKPAPSWQLPTPGPPAPFPLTSVCVLFSTSSQMFSNKRSFFRIHASWRPRYPLACSFCPHSSLPHPVQGLERGTG